jgi:multiple sugar transport system substrate-binding protein
MHKRRSKLFTALAVAAVAAIGLAGCSSGGTGAAKTADGKVTVTFWQQKFEDYQQTWYKKWVDKYNASQDKIHIDYEVVPGDTWAQKLKAAQAAGKQPDVATTNYGSIAPGVAQGQFADLDGLIPQSAFDDIKDNVKSFVQVDGKNYAYPMLVEPSTVLYYRTDLVKAAGLDPNSPPKTWAELEDWAKKLTTGKVKGFTIASNAADLSWSSWGLQMNACGHFPINDDWSKAQATQDCYKPLLNFYKDMYQKGYMPKQPKVGYTDATPFGQGEVAMMANGSWAVGQLKNDFKDMVAKTAVAEFPSVDGDASKPTATLGGWSLTIDSKSKVKKQAADFIKYLLAGDPSIPADFFKTSGYSKYTVRTTVDQAIAKDPAGSDDPFMKIISADVVSHGVQEPAYPGDINTAFGTAIESAMKGNASVDKALQTAQSQITSVIQKQQLAGTGPGSK